MYMDHFHFHNFNIWKTICRDVGDTDVDFGWASGGGAKINYSERTRTETDF